VEITLIRLLLGFEHPIQALFFLMALMPQALIFSRKKATGCCSAGRGNDGWKRL